MVQRKTVLREIFRAAKAEGFKKPEHWVCFYFAMGYSLSNLWNHFQWTRNYYCSYNAFYNNAIIFAGELYHENRNYRVVLRRAVYEKKKKEVRVYLRTVRKTLATSYSILINQISLAIIYICFIL